MSNGLLSVVLNASTDISAGILTLAFPQTEDSSCTISLDGASASLGRIMSLLGGVSVSSDFGVSGLSFPSPSVASKISFASNSLFTGGSFRCSPLSWTCLDFQMALRRCDGLKLSVAAFWTHRSNSNPTAHDIRFVFMLLLFVVVVVTV
jgi:hypothetical protein